MIHDSRIVYKEDEKSIYVICLCGKYVKKLESSVSLCDVLIEHTNHIKEVILKQCESKE